ncbi:MAG: hypothetical protein AAF639_19740 [Chloroflexota bacterium]
MPIVLSISSMNDKLWMAGPEGLFAQNGTEDVAQVPQPQRELACCSTEGNRILVGGLPHGIAFSLDEGVNWQASWMDGVDSTVLCIAPDPQVESSGVLLAGSAGGGILRTHDRGHSWVTCNFGLQDYTILSLTWAPVMDTKVYPRWEVVFATTEEGVYRSPNAGRGWKRCNIPDGVYQAMAVAPEFHAQGPNSGTVLVGAEETGLWRSTDGGRVFTHVDGAPERVDALAATADGWMLSDETGLWRSADGLVWEHMPDSQPALTLVPTADGVLAGGEQGVSVV